MPYLQVSGYETIDYAKILSPEELKLLQNGGTYKFDHYNNLISKIIDSTNCTKPGPICGSCETVYECIQIGGGFILEQLENCKAGSTCLESTGTCTPVGTNPICDDHSIDYIFTCRQVGVFPDAFNCQKYHICVPLANSETVAPESIPQTCNEGFYYDSKTTLCRYKLTDDTICSAVVPPCSSAGEAGIVPHNPALYYICLRSAGSESFSPQMFACHDNTVYDLNAKACVDPTPITGTDAYGKCIGAGNFYDPITIFFYFECSGKGANPIRRSCGTQKRFNYILGECVDITWEDFE